MGQSGEIAFVEAEAFGGTAKEKDAFGEKCEGAEGEHERGGGELGFRGREEPEGSGGDGENEIEGGAAGMVFEVAGEVFEEKFAERHAESVAQRGVARVVCRIPGARRKTPATVGGRYKVPERSPCTLAGLKPGRYIRMAR